MTNKEEKKIYATYVRSSIGCNKDQKETIRILGFRKLGQKKQFIDSSSLRGMLLKVQHLVCVEE